MCIHEFTMHSLASSEIKSYYTSAPEVSNIWHRSIALVPEDQIVAEKLGKQSEKGDSLPAEARITKRGKETTA